MNGACTPNTIRFGGLASPPIRVGTVVALTSSGCRPALKLRRCEADSTRFVDELDRQFGSQFTHAATPPAVPQTVGDRSFGRQCVLPLSPLGESPRLPLLYGHGGG